MAQIQEKDSYTELTEKQQAVVDELVADPTAQNTDIADRAGVSRSTVYNVKEHYNEIIESRMNQHGRYPGQETTEGNPFKSLDKSLGSDNKMQSIQDRPRQGSETGVEPEPETTLTIRLTESEIREVLEHNSLTGVEEAVIQAVLRRAFE